MSLKFNFSEIDNNLINFQLPEDIGYGAIKQFPIEEGLVLQKFDITPRDDLVLEHTIEHEPILACSAFIDGEINYHNKQFKFNHNFKQNSLTLCAVNSEDGLSYYKKDLRVKAFNLMISPQFIEKIILNDTKNIRLNKIIDKLYGKPLFEIITSNFFDYDTIMGLRNIDNMPFNSGLEKIYIQSKVYDLVYKCLNEIESNDDKYLSKEDIYYLDKVKEFILQNLDKSFNLIQLSKIASTNENKLQKNFKIYFKQTIFDFILDCRMREAKELLKNSDYNINEISQKVGYKYQSNFSIAFTKKFGILPKDIMKQRSYYIM